MIDKATIKIRDINGEKMFSLDALLSGVGGEVVIIGTADDAHVKVENPKVSPHHGCFFRQNGMWAYQDMDSEAGSSVNGEKIHSIWLSNGMKLVLDSKQYPDSTIIEIEVGMNGDRQLLPGEIPIKSGSAGAYGYPTDSNSGGSFGSFGSSGGYGSRTNRYGESTEPRFGSSQNIFGLLAGILWAIAGVVNLVIYFRDFKTTTDAASVSGGYGFFIWIMLIAQFAMMVGMIMLAVGLFSYNKALMFRGSRVLSTGSVTTIVTIFLLLMIMLGSYFFYIFKSFESFLLIVAFILSPMSLVSQSINFRLNYESNKIYNRFYRPIIYYGCTLLIVAIVINSVSSRLGMRDIGLSSLSNIWLVIILVGAVTLSGVYLHVDENPSSAARFALGGGGYNQQGYNQGGYNQQGYNQGGYNQQGYNQGGYNQQGFNQNGNQNNYRNW